MEVREEKKEEGIRWRKRGMKKGKRDAGRNEGGGGERRNKERKEENEKKEENGCKENKDWFLWGKGR